MCKFCFCLSFILSSISERCRFNINTFFVEDIKYELSGFVVFVDFFVVFGVFYVFEIFFEEVRVVYWVVFGFGVELCREDGMGFVDYIFVVIIVEVDEVFFEFGGEGVCIDGVIVVLVGDVVLVGGEVEGGDVVGMVIVF